MESIQLIYNLAILAAVSVVSGFIDARWNRNRKTGLVLQGIAFGIIAMIAMLNPYKLNNGIIFDGRSIVLSLCALFFGPVSGSIAGSIAIITRLYIGGNGALMGISVISASVIIGLLFHHFKNQSKIRIDTRLLFIFGLAVHLAMILLMIMLPAVFVWYTFRMVAIPILIFYPIATVLIGKILFDQENTSVFLTEIRKSEKKFRSLFDTMSQGVLYISNTGKIEDANPAALRILGYTDQDLIGKDSDVFAAHAIHLDNTPLQQEEFPSKIALKTGVPVTNTVIGIFNPMLNQRRWISTSAIPQFIGYQTKPHRVHITFDDITERILANERLVKNEAQYRLLADHMTDMVWLMNLKLVPTYISPSIEKIRGFSFDELREMPLEQQITPDSFRKAMQVYNEEMTKVLRDRNYNPVISLELEFYKKDGSTYWSENTFTFIRDAKGIPTSVLAEGRDITSRITANEKIKLLSRAVDQSPASIIITDIRGNIQYVNQKALEVTGYQRDEVIGKNPRIFSSGELPNEAYANLWTTISQGNEWRGEFHNKKKNGELYWEYASISPIKDENGAFSQFLAIKEDTTERKEFIAKLTIEKEKAEKAGKLKDAFIANISHEIRTPLNGVLGMTELIKEDFSQFATDENRLYFSSIDKSAKRLMNTVDTILYFSRLQIGDYSLSPEPASLEALLQQVITENQPDAEEKNLQLLFRNLTSSPVVYIDSESVTKAISNIINNAIKYTESGSVIVTLYQVANDDYCIDCTDTGIGISDEYLKRLFEPYSQEEVGYSRSYEGLGLGLPIVKKILDLNNTGIAVKSNKGSGTTITLTFRKQSELPEQPPVKTIKPAAPASTVNKPTILIVEDDAINQFFIKKVLSPKYNAVGAADADAALQKLDEQKIDLILMDISLRSGRNGLQLTRAIRNGSNNPNIIIIAVTAHALDEDIKNCMNAGCNDFLAKPFTTEQLLGKIANHL